MTPARAMIGVPSAPKATGAVLAMSERPEAASGRKPSPMRMAAVTATGVPNPAAPSKNAPEGEGDEQELKAAVAGDPGQAGLEDGEMAFLRGQGVEEDDVQDDPADREEPVGGAENGRGAGLARGHAEDGHGDERARSPRPSRAAHGPGA